MSATVQAAGGLVVRVNGAGEPEVLVVHRPHYDDWSLPKGKLDAGETHEDAARREIAEETGLVCALGDELPPHQYTDRHGRPKIVRFWRMTVTGSMPWKPNDEVDELRWVTRSGAAALLTYDADRRLVEHFAGEGGTRR